MQSLRQIAVETDPAFVLFLVSDRLGIEPIDYRVLNGVGKEVISSRTVMANEVALHVFIKRNFKALVVLDVNQVHIKVLKPVFLKEIYDCLVKSRLALDDRPQHTG